MDVLFLLSEAAELAASTCARSAFQSEVRQGSREWPQAVRRVPGSGRIPGCARFPHASVNFRTISSAGSISGRLVRAASASLK